MQLKQKLNLLFAFTDRLRALPKRYTIPVGFFILFGSIYVPAFIIEKPVAFSYDSDTCIKRLTLLPGIHRSPAESTYEATLKQDVQIGSWRVATRSVCITPVDAPQPGVTKVTLSPYGGWFAQQTFSIKVGSPVMADTKILDRPIPVSRPLEIRLSGKDTVFSYVLRVADKQTQCATRQVTLSCGVEALGLVQSQAYSAKLVRQFNNKDVATIVAKSIQTLSATTIKDSSIKASEIVYGKPTEIAIATDKKLTKVDAILYRLEGESRTEVPTSVAITDTGYVVKIVAELPRSSDYELVTRAVEAIDGSGLVQAHTLAFKTSGGPKVVGVNVGSTGVALGSTVVVTFDQSLSDRQDVSKFITLSGGVTLVNRKDNQLFITTNGTAKCTDFTIKITSDLQSQFDIGGNSAWNFTSRTTCYTIGAIGTSVQGRSINAYYFGDGATTILYTGAIHGSEGSTKALMERWIQDLDTKARTIPAHVTVVVVPVINPDGMARGDRVNANNVDLNRNFATGDWQKDITTVNNQPFPGGGGESAMSEPEVKAISGLAQRLRPKVILSYHSIGSMVAANQAGNSVTLAATYAQLSGYRNITGQSDAAFEYSVTGTADDWYAQAIGVPSLLVELGSHSYHQFERNQAAMWAMINS